MFQFEVVIFKKIERFDSIWRVEKRTGSTKFGIL